MFMTSDAPRLPRESSRSAVILQRYLSDVVRSWVSCHSLNVKVDHMPHRVWSYMYSSPRKSFRATAALLGTSALLFAAGCSAGSEDTAAPMTTASPSSDGETSTSVRETLSSSATTSADPRIPQPTEFELPGGKHAFRLEGSTDGCWFNPSADMALHCDLTLTDPPLVEDDNFPSPQKANMIGLSSPDSGFEFRYSPLEGGHNADLNVLEPNQTLVVDGISCTAESAISLSCETTTESFEYADGAVRSEAPGLNRPSATTSSAANDTSCPGIQMANGDPLTMQITGSTPMDCEEVRDVSAHYTEIITNMTQEDVAQYGNSGIREFDGWMCSAPSAGMAQTMGYTFKCTNDDEGKEFLSPS